MRLRAYTPGVGAMIALLFLAFCIVIAFYVLAAMGRMLAYLIGVAMLCGVLMMGVVVVDKVVTFFSPTTHIFAGEPAKVASKPHKAHHSAKAKLARAHGG